MQRGCLAAHLSQQHGMPAMDPVEVAYGDRPTPTNFGWHLVPGEHMGGHWRSVAPFRKQSAAREMSLLAGYHADLDNTRPHGITCRGKEGVAGQPRRVGFCRPAFFAFLEVLLEVDAARERPR